LGFDWVVVEIWEGEVFEQSAQKVTDVTLSHADCRRLQNLNMKIYRLNEGWPEKAIGIWGFVGTL
jgi:hypothetical protein